VLRQGCGVTRAMQDANNHERILVMHIVDGAIAGKTHAQAWREILARGRGERKISKGFAILLDLVDESRRSRLGSFTSNIEPDFGKVGFGLLG
jgi:hypothetical protein